MSLLKKKKNNKAGFLGALVLSVGAVTAALLSDKKTRSTVKKTVAQARKKAETTVKELESKLAKKKNSLSKPVRKVKVVRKNK